MKYDITTTRRLFRNRFESFVDHNDASGAYVNDGVSLNLVEVCKLLENDTEPFPQNYNTDCRKVCGHEYLIWLRQQRTYGDVARLLTYRVKAMNNGVLRPRGRWVSALLHGEEIPQSNTHSSAYQITGTVTN